MLKSVCLYNSKWTKHRGYQCIGQSSGFCLALMVSCSWKLDLNHPCWTKWGALHCSHRASASALHSGLAPGQQNQGICASGAAVILMSDIIYLQADADILDKLMLHSTFPRRVFYRIYIYRILYSSIISICIYGMALVINDFMFEKKITWAFLCSSQGEKTENSWY